MSKKVFIFWTLFVAVAFFRVWNSGDASLSDSRRCLREKVEGVGIIKEEPQRKDSGQSFVVHATNLKIASTSQPCASDLLIKAKTKLYPELSFGDEISFQGKLLQPQNFSSADGRTFDYKSYLAKDEIYFEMKSATVEILEGDSYENGMSYVVGKLFRLKKSFVKSLGENLGEPHSALASGLVVGEKAALGKDLLDDFRTVGLIHIVVLSGYNITIVADALRKIFSFLPRLWGISFGGIGIFLFGILVGGGATVVRSCFMAMIALFADVIRRDYSVVRALLFAGLIMVIENPKILFHDPSFQLSFLATLGLIILAGPIEKRLTFITEKFGIRSIVASTIATQIFVSPYLLYMMGQISVIGMIVNILVLPFVPLTMLLVFMAGSLGIFSVAIAQPFAWACHLLLCYELFMVNKFSDFPLASLHFEKFSFWWVVGFYGVFAGILIWRKYFGSLKVNVKTECSNLHLLFSQFQKLSLNVLVDKPNDLIYTDFYLETKFKLFGVKEKSIVFTRRTLKHLAEKGKEGKRLLTLMPTIIGRPDVIFKNRGNRYLIAKFFPDKEGEPHVVVVERNNEKILVIITSFVTDKKYLKNFEILWRTGTSFS